jgi:hypothetical protein
VLQWSPQFQAMRAQDFWKAVTVDRANLLDDAPSA